MLDLNILSPALKSAALADREEHSQCFYDTPAMCRFQKNMSDAAWITAQSLSSLPAKKGESMPM